MRKLLRVTTLIGVSLAGMVVTAGPASAATSITAPTSNPFVVPKDAGGNPVPFTVSAAGFAATSNVFIEQCDGVTPDRGRAGTRRRTATWAALRRPRGRRVRQRHVRHGRTSNHTFHPFKGSSPQGMFNCLSLNDPSPNNGLTDYRTCKIRVSTNNSAATADQVFLQHRRSRDDPAPWCRPRRRLAIARRERARGDTRQRGPLTFTVTLSRPSLIPVTFYYATVAGTATAGTDFVAKSGQVTIPAGVTSARDRDPGQGRLRDRADETFKVRLSNADRRRDQHGQRDGHDPERRPAEGRSARGHRQRLGARGEHGSAQPAVHRLVLRAAARSPCRSTTRPIAGTATAGDRLHRQDRDAHDRRPARRRRSSSIPIKGDYDRRAERGLHGEAHRTPVRAVIGRANATGNILKDD